MKASNPTSIRSANESLAFFPSTADPMEYAGRGYREWVDRAGRIQNEVAMYWSDACQDCYDAIDRLGRSTTFEEAIAIQSDLATAAVQRFWSETQKMGAILAGAEASSTDTASASASSRDTTPIE